MKVDNFMATGLRKGTDSSVDNAHLITATYVQLTGSMDKGTSDIGEQAVLRVDSSSMLHYTWLAWGSRAKVFEYCQWVD